MLRTYLLLFVVGSGFAACGPNGEDDICACPRLPDATSPPDDASLGFEVGADAPADSTFNGGGDFLCNGCICDGTLSYCAQYAGGHAPVLDAALDDASDDASDASDDAPFGDAGMCIGDAGSACTPIPLACLPKPTCECLLAASPPTCTLRRRHERNRARRDVQFPMK